MSEFDPFPLTSTQEAYLVGRNSAMDLGSIGCHGYWEWDAPVADHTAVERAWRRVVDRHPSLRTVIRPDGTQQVMQNPPQWTMDTLDLTSLPQQDADRELHTLRERLSHHVFDPYTFPLWDVRISLLPSGGQRIHFSLDLLIADAWSYFHVLVPEFAAAYRGEDLGALPSATFRRYVTAHREHRASSAQWADAEAYWLARLDTLAAAPQLPSPSLQRDDVRFERRADRLEEPSWQDVKRAAARRSLTPTALIAALFAEVLRAWGADRDLVLNLPVFSGSRTGEFTGVVGDFTSTVLLELSGGDELFADRARAAQRQLWRDLPHSEFSGIDVARGLARTSGTAEVSFPIVLTSLLGQPPQLFHTALGTSTYTSTQTPQVSLDFQVSEVEGALSWSWDYRAAMFVPGMVDDMFNAWGSLLRRLGTESAWTTRRFDLLPEEHRRRHAAANATEHPIPAVALGDDFDRLSRSEPQEIAVIDGDGVQFTRGELQEHIHSIAGGIASRVRDPQSIAVLQSRSWRDIAIAQAVTAAGHAYVPLDPGQPEHRLAAIVASCRPGLLVTDDAHHDLAQLIAPECLIETYASLAQGPRLPESLAAPDGRAYVIYTSGSTGAPKGVVVAHSGAVNAFEHMNDQAAVTAADRAIAVSPFHFDLSVYDTFGIFMRGGSLVVPLAERHFDPAHWCDLVQEHNVTIWNSVPALLELLVDYAVEHQRFLPSLRMAILAGDWIPVDLPARAEEVAAHIRVIASGGPAETCVWSIINPLPKGYRTGQPSIPYGVPMWNQKYHILDDEMNEVPDWVAGEMWVESAVGLAQGYLGDDEQTARSFVPWESGQRAYRTGDMGRWLPSGDIEFMGRTDFQVKIDGVRIELGEIEAALRRHPNVKDAAVVRTSSALLGGFVVLHDTGTSLEEDLVTHTAAFVPRTSVPSFIQILDSLPLTANGKMDRRRLESWAPARQEPVRTTAGSPVETVLEALWRRGLSLDESDPLEPSDSFFALGGTSLDAIRLTTQIAALLECDIDARLIFAHPTVAGTAQVLLDGPHQDQVRTICHSIIAA